MWLYWAYPRMGALIVFLKKSFGVCSNKQLYRDRDIERERKGERETKREIGRESPGEIEICKYNL